MTQNAGMMKQRADISGHEEASRSPDSLYVRLDWAHFSTPANSRVPASLATSGDHYFAAASLNQSAVGSIELPMSSQRRTTR